MASLIAFFIFFVGLAAVLLLLSAFRQRKAGKLHCDCEVCRSYLDGSWRKEFANLCDWYTHLLRQSPTGTIHVHALRNVVTASPANVEYMLKTNFDNYPKGNQFSAILGDLLGQGIFNVDGEKWKFQRKNASMELGSVAVRQFAFEIINSEIESRLIPLLSSSRELELQDIFKRFSFDNICKFSFGFDPAYLGPSLPVSHLAAAFDEASALSAQRALYASPILWKMKRFFDLGSEKKLRESVEIVKRSAEEIIKDRRRQPCIAERKDLLSRFMVADDDEYLRDIVISFLLAGRDTVAAGLTAVFYLLSRNPRALDKIREESLKILGTEDSVQPTYEQLTKMEYLNAVVHESLRLLPPVQFDSKFALNDDVLPDGTPVKAGIRVTYHQYAMGRMGRIWGSDAEEFRPERWLDNGRFMHQNPFKFPVFHAGFRTCLGKEMALLEMKTCALAIVRLFDIRFPEPDYSLRFVPGLTATLQGGLPAVIEPRI